MQTVVSSGTGVCFLQAGTTALESFASASGMDTRLGSVCWNLSSSSVNVFYEF
jgi:hypothetical protein